MSVNVKLKRSAVPNKAPLISSLELGELALNTHDGCIYLKRDGLFGEQVVKFSGNNVNEQTIILDSFIGDGTQVSFTLSAHPEDEQYVFISINGIKQQTTAYTVSGNVLTFTEAPAIDDVIETRTFIEATASVILRDYKTYLYQPTTNTTTFTGQDLFGNNLEYDLEKLEVFVNGVRLVNGLDYTATTGNSVTIPSGLGAGDTLEIVSLAKAAFIDWDNIKPNTAILTTTTASQVVDTFRAENYRTAKYLISVSHNSLGFHSTEILLMHDNTDVYTTEYGTIFTIDSLGAFSGSILNGMVRLLFSPINTNTTVKLQRITVAA